MKHQLEADSIVLNYGSRNILSDIYIQCETGKITGLLGRNGNGKSSLMNIIYGTLKPADKSIRFNGNYVDCAYQVPELIAYLTQFNFTPKGFTLSRIFDDFEVSYREFEKAFPDFALRYNHKVGKLSGGQIRLAETYLLLHSKAKFVLLDEPFTHLSPVMTDQVKELISGSLAQKGILLSDHLYREVIAISKDLYLLSEGKMKKVKDPEELAFMGYINR